MKIRLNKSDWAKAWRAMIEVGPVQLIRDDPVYVVGPAHLEILTRQGFRYEVLPERGRQTEQRRNGKAD
jgi:hypothetical protein